MKTITEQIFYATRKTIKETLDSKIQGEFKIFLTNDTIYIDIYGNRNIYYRYAEYDFSDKALKSITGKTIAENCIKQYRKYINSIFFK